MYAATASSRDMMTGRSSAMYSNILLVCTSTEYGFFSTATTHTSASRISSIICSKGTNPEVVHAVRHAELLRTAPSTRAGVAAAHETELDPRHALLRVATARTMVSKP